MKCRLSNEKGYSLFIAVLITVVFMVIAVSLLTMTMAGTSKSSTREEFVQSTELSEKGMQHITQQINTELQNAIPETGLLSTHFLDELEGTLNEYLCDGGSKTLEVETETGIYEACVVRWKNDGENELRKIVTLESTGIVNGKERTLTFTVAIGANAVPDALNYALGVHKTCTGGRDCIPGEGNLFLHGASSIEGDLKVDGNIITTDRGYAYLGGGQQWIESHYPSALPGPNTNTSKLVLGGEIYTFSNRPNYDTHIARTTFTSYKNSNLNEAFINAPQLVQRSPVRDKVEITEQRKNFRYGKNDEGVTQVKTSSFNNQGDRYKNDKVFPYQESCTWFWCSEETTGTYTFNGNNTFKRFSTDGDVTIRNTGNSFGRTTIENGMYVNGNLYIGNGSDSYNPTQYDKIQLSGPIYVNGNLTIKGADAELNTLIYVNGEVTIQNSRINGLTLNGNEGSLIIFANKQIKISNNSVNQNTPSNIRGYFYSDAALEMFGVGSNLRIEGGLSARRIVLNAIRGRSSSSNFTGAQRITNSDFFEGKENQVGKPSRLQIIYNPEIINTYADLKQQEPVIYDVEPPKVMERS